MSRDPRFPYDAGPPSRHKLSYYGNIPHSRRRKAARLRAVAEEIKAAGGDAEARGRILNRLPAWVRRAFGGQ